MSNYRIAITLDGRDNASDELRNVNRELDGLGNHSGGVKSLGADMGMLAKGAGAVGAAMAAMELVGRANEMAQFGAQVTLAADTFERVNGGAAQANIALNLLREATGGIVDDMTLMQGANQLMITGLAKTGEEAAELTRIAVTLGQRLGNDVAYSIENLNAALLNNSYERLDTLGVSAANVRERVKELKEEGMEMSAAFAQAVIEQGNAALDTFGFSLSETATNVNLLETAFTNMGASVSQTFSDLREDLAGVIADVIGLKHLMEDIEPVGTVAFGASERVGFRGGDTVSPDIYAEAVGIALEGELAPLINQVSSVGLRALMTQPGLASGMGITEEDLNNVYADLVGRLGAQRMGDGSMNFSNAAVSRDESWAAVDAMLAEIRRTNVEQSGIRFVSNAPGQYIEQQEKTLSNSLRRFGELFDPANLPSMMIRTGVNTLGDFVTGFNDAQMQAAQEQAEALSLLSSSRMASNDFYGTFSEMTGGGSFAEIGGIQIFDPANLEMLEEKAQAFEDAVAAAAENPFVDEMQLDILNAMADRARGLADNAKSAADAFERMTLSELFGEQDGGAQGEFNQMIAANIEDPAAREEFLRQAGLMTGEVTDAGLLFEEQIAPTIAALAGEQGGVVAAEVGAKALEIYQAALLAGIDPETAAGFAQQAVGFTVGEGGGGEAFSVNPGEGFNAVMGRTGMSREELEASGAVRNGYLQPGTFESADGEALVPLEETEEFKDFMVTIAESSTTLKDDVAALDFAPVGEDVLAVNDNVITLQDTLTALGDQDYKANVRVELLFTDPTGRQLGTDSGFQAAVLQALRQRGVTFEAGNGNGPV